ncbi:MAG: hypothetical protein H6823_23955 [Planctomycetaceae bacterium]|nr:hypothetical protein [Planctomycetaceae bacterium]
MLIDGPIRVVYWMGEPVPVEWNENENPWDLLNVMARHPNTTVDKEMCKSPQRTPLKARRSRLSKLLENHQELDSKIVSVRGIGYRLELVRDEVIVLEADGPEDLKVRR